MRVVIRIPEARRARALQDTLAQAGVHGTAMTGAAATHPAPAGEDIALMDGDAPGAPGLAIKARAHSCTALAYVGARRLASGPGVGLDAWIALDAPPAHLKRRLERIYRDGLFAEEARARRRTAAELGLDPTSGGPSSRAHALLYVSTPNPAYLAFERVCAELGVSVRAVLTSFAAFDHLHDERFDAVVLNADAEGGSSLSLLTAMRRNTDLHEIPVLTLLSPADDEASKEARLRGADWTFARSDDLRAAAVWLHEDMRRLRLRQHSARVLAALPEAVAPWSRRVFAAHLNTLANAHHERGRALTLACLRIEGAPRTEIGAKGLADIAGLLPRLLRGFDSVGALGGATWMFAMPATAKAEGLSALTRLQTILSATAFVAGERDRAALRVRHWAVELAPGESGAGLFARVVGQIGGLARRA